MSDSDVATLLGFVDDQLTPDQARMLLRQSGSLDAAINKFFDNPASCFQAEDTTYEINAFAADRSGERDHNSLPSFNIVHAPGIDHYPHSTTHSVPPSRPPSRTSVRSGASPLNGDIPVQSIEDMQESGIIGKGGSLKPIFGPANRDNYDNNWAMVLHSTSTELIPDAAACARRREEDGPAIIKPLPSGNYLPALLTILHSIPSIRNAFLCPEASLSDYNAGDEWWKGNPSIPARTVEYGTEDESRDLELLYETQRLMALLDSSNRAYGTVGGLQQLETWSIERSDLDQPDSDHLKFLLKWGDAYEKVSNKSLTGVLRTAFGIGNITKESFLLDPTVPNQLNETNLYDVIDDELFESASERAHIIHPSNVLIFRLENPAPDATSTNCAVFPTFHADRYLESNKDVVDTILAAKRHHEGLIRDIDARAAKIKYHTSNIIRRGERLEVLQMLEISMKGFQPKPDSLIDDPKDADVLAKLQALYDNIERKLQQLDEEKQGVQNLLDKINSEFKRPLHDAEETTSTKPPPDSSVYRLCGVSTHPSVYYIKHPDATATDDWWRMEYTNAATDAYILRDRVTEAIVLDRAKSEHKSVLLVYANDDALSEKLVPLTEALCEFLRTDNQIFEKELDSETRWDKPVRRVKKEGNWTNDPPSYQQAGADYYGDHTIQEMQEEVWHQEDWDHISSKELREQMEYRAVSSTTLTPNADDYEEKEFNGGIDSWAGVSNASSDTVGGEVMEITVDGLDKEAHAPRDPPHGTVNLRDVEMVDVDLNGEAKKKKDEGPTVKHIEMVEKKGG